MRITYAQDSSTIYDVNFICPRKRKKHQSKVQPDQTCTIFSYEIAGLNSSSHQDRYKCIDTIAGDFRWSEIEMKSDRERRQGRGSSFRSGGGALHRRPPSIAGFSRVSIILHVVVNDQSRTDRYHARMPCNLHPGRRWSAGKTYLFRSGMSVKGRKEN